MRHALIAACSLLDPAALALVAQAQPPAEAGKALAAPPLPR